MAFFSSGWAIRRAKRRRIPGVLLALGVVITMVSAPTAVAQAAITATWTGPSTIPSAMTYDGGPALATYDGLLYAAWQGQSSPYHIWYATFNGTSWSHQAEVPQAETGEYTGPSLGVYDGDLYLAWQGQSSPYHIWYAAFNGTTWTNEARVPNALVNHSSAVGLAGYDGDLYLTWTGQSSPYDIWYATFNGTTWSGQHTIPSATSIGAFTYAASPLAVYNGVLYAMWPTGPKSTLDYAVFFGGSWSSPLALPDGGVLDYGGPALTVMDSKLYASWDSQVASTIKWASFSADGWSKPQTVPHAMSLVGPGLAGYDGSLYDAWTPDIEGSPIDYSVHS
jgi:hypothetical protein